MKILVAGDFCPHNRVAGLIEEGQFDKIWNDVPSFTKNADYCILNLECPIVEHQAAPIVKCGPNLKCSSKVVDAIKFAGFDCVTLANNHFYDYGEVGVKDTLRSLQIKGIDYVGGGVNSKDASKTLLKKVDGKKIAIINCCEHEFSIATKVSGGANPLNIVKQVRAISQAKREADIVIVIIHGGVEHFWLPTDRMKDTYRFFVDAGADAVINHHQHCYSGYEIYNNKPIFYGLGNFCFDWNNENEHWSTGFFVNLVFTGASVEVELHPYRQCYKDDIGVRLFNEEECGFFNKQIIKYNDIIANDAVNEQEYLQWCKDREGLYKFALNPFYNRITRSFFESSIGRKILRKKMIYAKNMIENESHVERLRMVISSLIQ